MPFARTSQTDWGDPELSEALEEIQEGFRYCHPQPLRLQKAGSIAFSTEADVASLFGLFGQEIGERLDSSLRLSLIEKVVLELRDVVAQLIERRIIQVPISSLGVEDLVILQPLTVVVESQEDHFSATFFDANVNASGDTEVEAVDNLKEVIVSIFRHFGALGEPRLGAGPRRQYGALKQFIKAR